MTYLNRDSIYNHSYTYANPDGSGPLIDQKYVLEEQERLTNKATRNTIFGSLLLSIGEGIWNLATDDNLNLDFGNDDFNSEEQQSNREILKEIRKLIKSKDNDEIVKKLEEYVKSGNCTNTTLNKLVEKYKIPINQ